MKYFFILFLAIMMTNVFAIDSESFKNKDKYEFLKLTPVGKNESELNVNIFFHPPEGKKVNSASMIRLWENNGKDSEWVIADKAYASGELSILHNNQMEKKLNSKNVHLEQAIEIDFIHCNYSGGQCQMQKYLGKIMRSKKSKNHSLELSLKLPEEKKR